MLKKAKKPLLFVLGLLPFAVIGGFFTSIYAWEGYTPEAKAEILGQIASPQTLYLMGTVQTVLYAAVFGFFGYLLSDKIGLMRPIRFEKRAVILTAALTLVLGVLLSSDSWIFGKLIPQIGELYGNKPSVSTWIASITYGGVIEEVMMRLFVMSLTAFALWKLFFRKKEEVPTGVLISANVLSALLFAAGHLPSTITMFGAITPLLLFRCFLLNSVGGLCFGHLYRKYGIQYAMLSHMGAHIVWKLIWALFI
ncbi:CPBP family glutamic-type intramembrane protease [Acutalibacter sp. 1XD8-33]|uniref:CPBP family glutamic-type intramembrane protease n=1 Tax=Acutalibacter sp. 1XD8-33 TaxID=2320081 RepID=UPI0018F58967|nr:CPBP family glutamic-type intramembrane protease [Acutalibacter sp. 1XD8-33]